ncbi:MAG: 50S ribosomal protein L3 [Legionellaceae bacterium]|nr:50S ribosomal protein L3 [Legionellaceae bacterium]
MIGLIGRKIGMTRVLTEGGVAIPVTVVELTPNRVSQIKTLAKDAYSAIQVTAGQVKPSRLSKPLAGHFAKAGVEAGDLRIEFRIENTEAYQLGQLLTVADVFETGDYVDVVATSRGKGFQGAIKRHNFATQDATHGNSLSHRAPGSIGQNQSPGRVFKGKKMAGHQGNVRCTTQNLQVVKIDVDRHLLLIKGAIPGAPGTKVEVTPAVKLQKRAA